MTTSVFSSSEVQTRNDGTMYPFSFSSFSKPPVFLLKTKSTPHDAYDDYFRTDTSDNTNGRKSIYEPVFIPVLEHRFNNANLQTVKRYFSSSSSSSEGFQHGPGKKRKYGGIIFTSQRAVEAFTKLLQDEVGVLAASAVSHSLILYSVGPATSRALTTIRDTHLPHAQIYGEDAGNGENLAHMILEHYNRLYPRENNDNSDGANKPALLFLVGEQRRDIIPKTLMSEALPVHDRVQVDELVVYETGEMASFESEFRAAVDAGERFLQDHRQRQRQRQRQQQQKFTAEEDDAEAVMWAVVFSPTGCDAMLRVLDIASSSSTRTTFVAAADNTKRRKCLVATIGPTTRDHLRNRYGFEPDVCAEKPSPDGVGSGIETFMRLRRENRIKIKE